MKKDNSILNFYKKRLIRIYAPLLLICGVYWGYANIIKQGNIGRFFSNITMHSFWGGNDKQVWFIALILVLYIIYPFIYKLLERDECGWYIAALILLVYAWCYFHNIMWHKHYMATEIALTRIPVFLLGCYVSKLVYEDRDIKPTMIIGIVCFLVAGLLYYELHPFSLVKSYRTPYLFVGPSIAVCCAYLLGVLKKRWLNKALTFFGSISLELYLSHIILRKFFMVSDYYIKTKVNHNYYNYVWFVVIGAIIISYVVNWLIKRLECSD